MIIIQFLQGFVNGFLLGFLTAPHRLVRPAQLLREPFCRECAKRGDRIWATVVDHIKPHRGSWPLFIDPANHQSLCKRCHDRKTALEQRKTGGFF